MATIDSRGFVDDGSSNLTVAGAVTVPSVVNSTTTLAGSGSVSIPGPGFFYVPATGSGTNGWFTGSVPLPGTYPGAHLLVCETNGGWSWQLTGSAFASTKAVFQAPPGTIAGSGSVVGQVAGTKLEVTKGGSVVMISDGYYWLVSAATGSLTFSGNWGP